MNQFQKIAEDGAALLQAQIDDLTITTAAAKAKLAEANRDYQASFRDYQASFAELQTLESKMNERSELPRVSDHAVVRYLERKKNFDFEEVRASMLTQRTVDAIKFGAQRIGFDGGKMLIRGNCITTWVEK